MIHGYHVVFGTYGFWLPNDQRGSWSDFVAAWELRLLGDSSKGVDRPELTERQLQWQTLAKAKLKYPEVFLNGQQALRVAEGFNTAIKKSGFVVWACSILPQHVHLVIARHRYKVEYIAGLMKGEATKSLIRSSMHPLGKFRTKSGKTPTPWNVKSYHGFLETEQEIEDAIAYVIDNPMKEGKKRQPWNFTTPFSGLDTGWTSYG